MATATDVIGLARRYRGVTESPSGSNNQQFGIWYGMNGEPWCAMFVSFILYTCGFRFAGASTKKGWSFCPSVYAYFAKRGKVGTTPKVGALALFHNGTRFYHIEIVTKVDASGSFTSIGGNTGHGNLANGGSVLEHKHPRDPRTHFCYLDYGSEKVVHPAPEVKRTTVKAQWTHNFALTSPLTKHADVRRAQVGLQKAGLLPKGNKVLDGVYGPDTAKAVKKFQQQRKLKADGVLGATTAAHLGL